MKYSGYSTNDQQEILSKDPDATWLKKGRRSYFGYKGFMIINQEYGYIEQVHVTPANKSEVKELETITRQGQCKRLYGEKGYASAANKSCLRVKGSRMVSWKNRKRIGL